MKRSIVKMVTVIVLVCLMTVVTYVPSFAGERIYVSDLYYLYPRYLSTENEAVKTCYSDAQEVLSSVSDADKWIMIGQTILSDPEYIIGETLASLGIDQSVEEEAMEDAAKKLIEEMSNSPGIAKKAAKESADAKQAFKYIETTSDWAKFILEMSTKDVPGSVIKEVMKDDSAWETLGGISEAIGSADEIMRFAATIELCEIIRMEEMDYLIDILDEDLAAPIIKYKSYVESNYATYITETYIQEHVIDEVIKVKNFIKLYEGEGFGFSAAYSLVKSTCSIIAKLDNRITGVGSSKDLLKASMLGNYVEVLDYNHRDLFEDITNGPVYYDDIKKFELNYEVYLASIKAFADSIKSVDKNYEDLMDENINAIKEYNIEDYYEDVKSAIKADDKDNRKVMTARPDSFYDFNDSDKIISIEGPTDEMEPETIYTGNGKVYFSIKTNKGVDFQCDAELQDLTITGKGNIAIDGNPNISIRNLIGTNDLTVEPETQKTLAVTNIVNHRIMSFKNVQLHVSNNICSDVTSYADADAFNNYLSLQNCSASIDGDLALNSYGSIRIDDSSVDVNNNIKAKGYALGGLSVNSGADIHVNGDIEIKGEGERNSSYGIYHYCTFNGGTIELKGDLLDLTDYSEYGELNVYGWIAYDDFHLKLIGDKAHTIKVQKTGRNEGQYGGVGILEVDSPEIIVDGHLRMTRLDTDLNVNSSVETFSIKEPVEGKRIFIAGSVAIENAGMKNGLELSESSTLSIQDDLTATLGLRVLGGSQLTVGGEYIQDCSQYEYGTVYIAEDSTAAFGKSVTINDYSEFSVEDAVVTIAGDIKAEGYALGGLAVYDDAEIHVNGDIEITGKGEYDNWYNRHHYCTFKGGTIELKGDLKDLTDYEVENPTVYAWIAYDDFHLKLIGDKVHTIKVQKTGRNEGQYGGVGILEVDSPGIIVDGHLRMTRLDTDLNVNSSVETFSIKEPVKGKRIFIAGSVTIENAGMKNGLELSESSTLSIQDNLTATLGLRVLGGSQLTVGGEYIQECSQYEYGTVYIAENSTAAFGKSVTINDYSEFGVEDAVVTIAQDIKAEGYALGGLAVYDDAEIHVNGDIEITGKGEYDNWYNRHHYCTFKSGTIELKGDLKDLTDYQDENPTVYAWIASDDFHLKLTGDRVQTIKVQRTGNSYDDIYGGMGMLEVTSPGIELMGVLAASSLESNLLIKDSDVTTITINNWNNKTVTITNTNIIPNTNLPADYGMMVSSNENAYSIIFEPSTNETYYVKYSIDGTVVKTTSQYEAGSLAWPYEMLTDSSDEYIWFKDTDMTQEWSMKTDTITEDTYLYGIDAESFQCKHDYQEVEGSAVTATCTKDGKEADQKCSRCNDVIKGAVIEKLGHNYKEVEGSAVDATCTKDGKEVDRKCSRCDDVIEGAVIEKLGHDWDEGVVTTEPGCETSGVKTFTCKNDATHTKTEPIDPIGHDWGDWEAAEPSTCVKEGQEVRICKHDSTHKDYRKAALLAHQLTHVDGVAATCEEGGSKEHWICSACGGIFSDAEGTTQITEADLPITPLGHAYGEWAPLDENQHQRVCTNDQKHTETAAHVWDAGVVTKEATETDTGETTFTCSICKAIRTETIPMIDKDPITPSDAAADQAIVDKSIPTVNTGKSKTTANIKKKQMTVKFPVEDAVDNYRIQYRLAGKSKWTNAWSAGTDTYVIKGLKKASLCEFRIAGYVKQADGSWARGKWSKSAYRYMGTVSLKAVKSNKKKQLTVTWAKDAKSTGYQIQYSLKSNMKSAKTVTVNGKAKTKATIRGLKSGKKYYVKVRPIKKASGKTYIGSLSKVKPAKIR